MKRSRSLVLDASGAVADLGVLIPISAALVTQNGFDAATVLCGVGALYLASGVYFRVPVPVQPIKAAAAIAIAGALAPSQLAMAGILIGTCLLLIGLTGSAALIGKFFSRPLIRGVQLGVGLILVNSALGLGGESAGLGFFAVAAAVALLLIAAGTKRVPLPLALVIVVGGISWSAGQGGTIPLHASLWHPQLILGSVNGTLLWSALILLVVPQIPLTLGNAVVAVVDVERRYFGRRAERVDPRSICISAGAANIAVGLLTGMPMCHGSGGLTAHHRAGARTWHMNLLIGMALLALGLFFGPTGFALLASIPLGVLAGLLAFTGTMHALLVTDLRGYELVIALTMGLIGLATSNLAISLAVGMTMFWPVRWAAPKLLAEGA
jgi:MFS superfamily sulfate permease-like transporter